MIIKIYEGKNQVKLARKECKRLNIKFHDLFENIYHLCEQKNIKLKIISTDLLSSKACLPYCSTNWDIINTSPFLWILAIFSNTMWKKEVVEYFSSPSYKFLFKRKKQQQKIEISDLHFLYAENRDILDEIKMLEICGD